MALIVAISAAGGLLVFIVVVVVVTVLICVFCRKPTRYIECLGYTNRKKYVGPVPTYYAAVRLATQYTTQPYNNNY